MKNKILLLFFISFLASNAQKVDLDHFYFDVNYQILPQEFVPIEKRTFSTNVRLGGTVQTIFSAPDINNKLNIFGWKKVDENATVSVDLNLEDFIETGATTETRVEEDKDKGGNVIARRVYYYVLSRYTTRGYANVKGPTTLVPLSNKEIESEKAKEAAASTNRFLKNVAIKKEAAIVNGFYMNLSSNLDYKSPESTDSNKPLKDFYLNKNAVREQMLRSFVENSKNSVINRINYTYGFVPRFEKQDLWILDAKSEEGIAQTEAIKAVRTLFSTMKADEPIDELRSNMQPLIDYFNSLKTKYTEDNKPGRKMRYSAYYNLAIIYLILDEPEKTILEAEKLILNDYDKSDGKGLINQANELIATFNNSKLRSRHNPPLK